MGRKKLEILHLNDFHSSFFAQEVDGVKTGGISYLANYITNERAKEENCIFLFAGDALNGDINDSQYSGVATFVMFSRTFPDAMAIGNHELDYGISQLSLLKELTGIPIVCANMKSYLYTKPLFKPYMTINKGGLNIFVVGITTPSIATNLKNDKTSYEMFFVDDYYDAIYEALKTKEYADADIFVVLSHIGFEEDKALANYIPNIKPTIIIGGHSHTMLEEPVYVNDIPIVQVGIGSSKIGKFSIYYDEESKKIEDTEYEIVDINENNCNENIKLSKYLKIVQHHTNKIYENVICVLSKELKNEDRNIETEFGCFFADVFNDICSTDLFLFDPGTTKCTSIGPQIKHADLVAAFTRENSLVKCEVTGKQLKQIFTHTLQYYGVTNNDDIFLQQTSKDISVIYDKDTKELKYLLYKNNEIKDDDRFRLGLLEYSLKNSYKKFSIKTEDIMSNRQTITMHPNYLNALYNYFLENDKITVDIKKRYIISDNKS